MPDQDQLNDFLEALETAGGPAKTQPFAQHSVGMSPITRR